MILNFLSALDIFCNINTRMRRLCSRIMETKAADFFQNKLGCEKALNMFSLFSNEKRFKILCVLNEGDFCVKEIARLIDGKYSNISQQLKMLTLTGYLEKQRRGKSVYYHLKDERIKNILRFLQKQFVEDLSEPKTKTMEE